MRTVRDEVISRISQQFGRPWRLGKDCRWTIHSTPRSRAAGTQPQYSAGYEPILTPRINIAVDSWKTPHAVKVWLLDCRQSNPMNRARFFPVNHEDQVTAMLQQIQSLIDNPRS